MTKQPAVYILANQRNGTLYVGVTSNIQTRAWQHRNEAIAGFTKKYGVHTLVYYELHGDMITAITREKTDQEVEPRLEASADRRTKS